MTGDTQGDINAAISEAFASTYQKVVGNYPELANVMKRRFDAPSTGINNAWSEFRDHFDAAGEKERIRKKARIYAQALFNEPGLQGSIQGFIEYLKKQGDSS